MIFEVLDDLRSLGFLLGDDELVALLELLELILVLSGEHLVLVQDHK